MWHGPNEASEALCRKKLGPQQFRKQSRSLYI
jgi:hypothetical protein